MTNKKTYKHVPERPPSHPAPFEDKHVAALQALLKGEATPWQQKLALEWIINDVSRAHALPYFPDNARDSDFAMGKSFVGQQILGLLKINMVNFNHPPQTTDEPGDPGHHTSNPTPKAGKTA